MTLPTPQGMLRLCALLLWMVQLACARAHQPGTTTKSDSLEGAFGFDWLQQEQACVAFTGTHYATLQQKYVCVPTPPDGKTTASGRRLIARCTAKESEYLVFRTRDDCNDERLTQEAHREE
jgi:hypothetical protein